jgi:16S rRNA G966 N2-methylase RsmD
MGKKRAKAAKSFGEEMAELAQSRAWLGEPPAPASPTRPSALLDTRVIYCGDCLEQLGRLPDACVDLIYIDPPFSPFWRLS